MTKKIKYHFKNISWLNTLFLLLTPPAAITLTALWLYFDGFDYRLVLLGVMFYVFSGVSITAGYHRLFAHRSYDAHWSVKCFFLVFGAAAFQNSVVKWASDHRVHHNKVDTEKDPYNINEGFFYAHMGWILLKNNNQYDERYIKDLVNDPLVRFQHKFYFPIAGFFGIFLPMLMGWYFFDSLLGGIAVGALLKIVLLHHCTFFINSLCHYIGTTPYTDDNTAKDSWIMAFLTFGEGYHNFHHYFQADYRNGIRWFQFDPTKWLIAVLAKIKLTSKLKQTPNFKIIRAQLQMKLKVLKAKYIELDQSVIDELENLKERTVDSIKKLEEVKKLYREKKKQLSDISLIDLKRSLEIAKADFRYNLDTFNAKLNSHKLILQ